MILFPGDEDSVHQRLFNDQVESGVEQLTEAVSIDSLFYYEQVICIKKPSSNSLVTSIAANGLAMEELDTLTAFAFRFEWATSFR